MIITIIVVVGVIITFIIDNDNHYYFLLHCLLISYCCRIMANFLSKVIKSASQVDYQEVCLMPLVDLMNYGFGQPLALADFLGRRL